MVKPAPSRFNPELLARQSERLSVAFPLAQCRRLAELLADDSGELNGSFKVSRQGKRLSAKGHFDTVFTLICQRCLSTYQHGVAADFDFALVNNQDEADALPEELDPVLLADDGMLHVVDMLEDELILQVPTVPKHADVDECVFEVAVDLEASTEAQGTDTQRGSDAFAELKKLRFGEDPSV